MSENGQDGQVGYVAILAMLAMLPHPLLQLRVHRVEVAVGR